jgi:hypothetical protein
MKPNFHLPFYTSHRARKQTFGQFQILLKNMDTDIWVVPNPHEKHGNTHWGSTKSSRRWIHQAMVPVPSKLEREKHTPTHTERQRSLTEERRRRRK